MMMRILLIDDDQIFNLIGKTLIQKLLPLPFEIMDYTDPHLAIEYLRSVANDSEKWPDYIFLDLRMPLYDGFEFLNDLDTFIDSVQPNKSKLFILSSSINQIDIERSKKHRIVTDFISKPLTEKVLKRILQLN